VPTARGAAAPAPLTDDDVTALRTRLAAGERPRVVIRVASAAVAAGTRGNVVRLGDPKEGEYVVVRLGKDEVPFAPSELGLPGRAGAGATTARPSPSQQTRTTRRPASAGAVTSTAAGDRAGTAKPPTPTAQAKGRSTRAAARGTGRSRQVPPLDVTLRFRNGGWTVEATRGKRRLARPLALRPGGVSAFAQHVDDEALRDALIETVDACRAVVEERAAALRAELAAAESSLRDYDTRR
jgi:hypothetical protein